MTGQEPRLGWAFWAVFVLVLVFAFLCGVIIGSGIA